MAETQLLQETTFGSQPRYTSKAAVKKWFSICRGRVLNLMNVADIKLAEYYWHIIKTLCNGTNHDSGHTISQDDVETKRTRAGDQAFVDLLGKLALQPLL